jgi:hypothetical protein
MPKGIYARMPVDLRFWSKVERSNDCWLWRGTMSVYGYGFFKVRGKMWKSHRYAWVLTNGAISNGLFVCHRCDVRHCVRPDHLFLGNAFDNMSDAARKGRMPSGERSWARLHPERLARGERNGAHTHPERIRRGVAQGGAKLTDEIVREIRAASGAGESGRSVAARYGVAPVTVSHVIRRYTWKHVQ